MINIADLAVVALLAALAPLVTAACAPVLRVPTVVVEILLGVLAGPAVFAWIAKDDQLLAGLSDFGLVLLMFLAGYEIDVPRIKGRPLRSALIGWFVSVALGLGAGLAVAATTDGDTMTGVAIGLALTTTALGTILPIVRDAGLLPTPMGAHIMAIGTVGEFAPIVAIALLLTGRHPGATLLALAVFAVLAAFAVWLAVKPNPRWLDNLVARTLHSSGQLAVRLAMLIMVLLVWFASELQLDNLMGAFTAGLVLRLALRDTPAALVEMISAKLDAIGFGFFIPIFFVMSGVGFDLDALLDSPGLFVLIPVFMLLFVLVRGVPTFLLASRGELASRRGELALFSATVLPLVVVITNIAAENGWLKSGTAAAMVGAGMLSVLVFPQLAMRGAGDTTGPRPEAFEETDGGEEDEVLRDR